MLYKILWFTCAIFSQRTLSAHSKPILNYYNGTLRSLNVSALTVTTLDVLLQKLHLDNCTILKHGRQDCGHRCVTPEYLYRIHGWPNSTVIGSGLFYDLSAALLYFLLPEKNAGPDSFSAKNCQHGAPVLNNGFYPHLLQYYETNGLLCVRLLDKILRDIRELFKSEDDSAAKKCFSGKDILNEVGLTEKDVNGTYFPVISAAVISRLVNGQCVKDVDTDNLPCRNYFTSNILTRFGNESGYLPLFGFEHLLEELGIGELTVPNDPDDSDHNSHRRRRDVNHLTVRNIRNYTKKCYTSHNLLDIYAIDEDAGISVDAFKELCPALVDQLVSKSCLQDEKGDTSEEKTLDKYVWLYGFVSVLIISLLSLVGVAIIPSAKGLMYKKIIIVLVALAVGTLCGDALLHLIPHRKNNYMIYFFLKHLPLPSVYEAAGFHSENHGSHEAAVHNKDFIWKFLVVASGLYGFFLFETFTHLFLRTGHGHSHDIEHTRKHSPFERNNSCRTMERHEMHFTHNPVSDNTETPQVIVNKGTIGSGKSNTTNNSCSATDGHHNDHEHVPTLLKESSDGQRKTISSVGWMIIIGDTIHNITDGIAIGAAFADDLGGGVSTSIAVFCHELPHELGDFAVLISSGMTVKQALFANFMSACSSFIGLVIGLLIGQNTSSGSQWVFALMGGMFLYIALVDMLPELMHSEELGQGSGKYQIFLLQNLGMLTGFVIMSVIAYYEEELVIPL